MFGRQGSTIKSFEKSWVYILIILGVSFVVFLVKFWFISQINFAGHADEAVYSNIASNLIKGKGFTADYVSFFFTRYSDVTRPEDMWPPLYSLLIVPSFLIWGKTAIAAKLPSIIIGTFLLPLATFYLSKEFFGEKIGLFSSLSVLITPLVFFRSLQALSDVAFSFLVILSTLLFLQGFKKGRRFLYMGVVMGLAFLCKYSGLLLFPIFLLFYFTSRLNDRRFLIGILIALVVISPWLLRNYMLFENPIYSESIFHNYIFSYEAPMYSDSIDKIYWNREFSLSELKEKYGFKGIINARYFQIQKSMSEFPSVFPFMILPLALLGGLLSINNRRASILWILIASFLFFHTFYWFYSNRYILPLVPLIWIMAWFAFFKIGNYILKNNVTTLLAVCLLMFYFIDYGLYFHYNFTNEDSPYPWREGDVALMEAGKWLDDNSDKNSVVMTFNPWEINFHSNRKTVNMPTENLSTILSVMQLYNTTHLIIDDRDPTNILGQNRLPELKHITDGKIKGFELVYNRGIKLYKVHWDKIDRSYLDPLPPAIRTYPRS